MDPATVWLNADGVADVARLTHRPGQSARVNVFSSMHRAPGAATRRIHTGQMITVDGTAGTVTLS